jgi:C-terminal processing protease CtpA/Prc
MVRSLLTVCACLIVAVLCPAQVPEHKPPPGSGVIAGDALTIVQITNLAILGKVWGFLKYHHPAITAGDRDWDRDLFQVMPRVLAAPDQASAAAVIFRWIADLGPITECLRCVPPLPNDAVLSPDLGWLNDKNLLGNELSDLLRRIYLNRVTSQQWYVSLAPGTRNPEFPHEAVYPAMNADFGLQLLAVFRFWNAIEYWFPYRDVIGANWDDVLKEYIPKVSLARTLPEYERSVLMLAARINDSHLYISASGRSRSVSVPDGSCVFPMSLRFVGNQAVVTAALADGLAVERGDVITEIDGITVPTLIEQLRPYYGASNDAAALRNIATGLTVGTCVEVKLQVRHNDDAKTVDVTRVPKNSSIRARWIDAIQSHELAGPAFRMLSDTVSYLKISPLKVANVREYTGAAQATKGLIIDLRGTPSDQILGDILDLVHPTFFARVTVGDLSNPGAFEWKPQPLGRREARSPLKIAVLVDELTQSYLEYGAMALRSAAGVLLVGSNTAGADGDTSHIILPGDLQVQFTGTGIFYPDGRPTQRIGLVPDVRVTSTIAGIKAGRDEVLEEAERQLEKMIH